ncbi:hypothetical protein NL108_011211, partial [Boleophthalmus pectinirostris]
LNKETVFEWFGLHLDPVRRLEFMCGLLHMCQPLELRFLGSYLEDLARKDYHILRDFECRANSPIELGNLTDVNDPVVRSKLLVCLSLLGSDSRECAGILFQTLSRVDPNQLPQTSLPCPAPPPRLSVRCQGGEAPVDGSSEQNQAAVAVLEQLALLFTMASLHPAFHFHQRQMLRAQLDKTQLTVEEEQRQSVLRRTAQALVKGEYKCVFVSFTVTHPTETLVCSTAEAVSGPDTLGESSSERSSCASSPQHRATDSLDSEEEQH